MSERCHDDWQGPSDAECYDDLLVIPCHVARFDIPHRGIHPDTGESVMWYRGTGELLSAVDGTVVQAQFRPAAAPEET